MDNNDNIRIFEAKKSELYGMKKPKNAAELNTVATNLIEGIAEDVADEE